MANLVLLIALSCLAGSAVASPSIVSPTLLAKLSSEAKANITIVMNSPVSTVYAQYEGRSYPRRGQLMTRLRQDLVDFTSSSQAPVRAFLQAQGVPFIPRWITNKIFIKGADATLVHQLASLYRSSILEIREEVVAQLGPVERVASNKKVDPKAPARGVWIVGAHKLWEQNITGEGLIVSNIDTGVRGTHEVLRQNFVGEYGWLDPEFESATPTDENGHGTHTMGTIAGQNGFGVAPGAKWMACVGCGFFGCPESSLIGCAEFSACPTLVDGSMPDCSKAPHVSSNSWGSTLGGQTWYDDAIAVMKMAGIIPVFSAGNAGGSCNTVGSPGDRAVIGVAATDMDDTIAYFSSRGPADGTDDHKPEISAPGVDVLSSWNTGDNAYDNLSGTSMACPHVSGGVALIIAANPTLAGNYDAIRMRIFNTAATEGVTGEGQNCGGIPDSVFPNHVFGYGRLDVPAAAAAPKK